MHLLHTRGNPSVLGKERQITFLCALCTDPEIFTTTVTADTVSWVQQNTPQTVTKSPPPPEDSSAGGTKLSSGVNPVGLGLVTDPELQNVTYIVRGSPVEAARHMRL